MTKKSIFVVEDEEDILELLKFHLTHEGYAVTAVTSGEAAVKGISRKPPDLILPVSYTHLTLPTILRV